ncbi:zinc finger protein ZAT9-like [Abrus precatorius]|uniref:Zinc finger protein ZAT9-like n=1 Tax=Abrus precatorius TaxID=3816 RepID=A0A8B8JZJ6_ABRPR|nr:zinc finger protein ZAT9-like [Abrus precatorius]
MEKHKCKLCFRNFSNGRALGGHMRSHMMNLPIPPKPNEFATVQLSFETESSPSSSSFEQDKSLSYGLRENPKRSFRIADPEFSFPADAASASVILQDRESETESSKKPTRKRSQRPRKLGDTTKTMNIAKQNESASSVSDTTTEEDVAFCLMMLSRDKWSENNHYEEQEEEEEEEEEQEEKEEDSDESEELKSWKKPNKVRGRYKCETCDKVFRSYQALGGHRASHKKIKVVEAEVEMKDGKNGEDFAAVVVEKKIHECPVCLRVFGSGQALGGHKRTHVIGSATVTATPIATTTNSVRTSTKFGDSLIDLNLPAPADDDDDVSQFDVSAVSDAEFVKLH